MEKDNRSAKKIGGPFLSAAVFCGSVSEDSDGVFSALRIVDEVRVNIPADAPADVPSKSQPIEVPLFALIIIRRGGTRVGKPQLRLALELPDGKTKELSKQELVFPNEHPNAAAIIKARITMRLHTPGLYWINVILGKQSLTRMPLSLVIQRAEPPVVKKK